MIKLATQTLPVSFKIMLIRQQGTMIYYPQVIDLQNEKVQEKINQTIFQRVNHLAYQQTQQQGTNHFSEMVGTFEIKTNERNILSLSLTNYAYAYQHANGLTLMTSLTFDIETGELYQLKDLFKPNSNYVEVLSRHVAEQIKERDIPLLGNFTGISPNQDFYIADKTLVLYYQAIQITPHYIGLPMFPISVYDLQDIVTENGPLGRMLRSN